MHTLSYEFEHDHETREFQNLVAQTWSAMVQDVDPFDSLLNIEEEFYEQGYQQGYQDGIRQCRLEARLFGIEKGFEKFVIMGKLQAKAMVWAARSKAKKNFMQAEDEGPNGDVHDPIEPLGSIEHLQSLPSNPRLEKHIRTLLALVNGSTLSTANTDDAVAEFDDRLKKAQAKEKVIEKILGETNSSDTARAQKPIPINRANDDLENFGAK